MIIRSLKLINIRSYIEEELTFPKGTVLLSGDIGSGKSTVLLAIEFAIFGMMKGLTSGNHLLRHGAKEGTVTLSFNIDNTSVKIERRLKRTSNGILQDSGKLTINEEIFEGTPQELKIRILSILGYPEDLINKSKNLIFRHTVFTAQDEMKQILYESKEERLETLRKLFNIDKYKRIKENSVNFAKILRENISFMEGKLENLPLKKQEIANYKNSIQSFQEEVVNLEKEQVKIEVKYEFNYQQLNSLEKQIQEALVIEKEFFLTKTELSSLENQIKKSMLEIESLSKNIEETSLLLGGMDFAKENEIRLRIQEKQQELQILKSNLQDIFKKKADNSAKKEASLLVLNKIAALDKCPLCLQTVSKSHIEDVNVRENTIINACSSNLNKLDSFEANFIKRQENIELELKKYTKEEQDYTIAKIRYESITEKKKRLELLNYEVRKNQTFSEEKKNKLELLENSINNQNSLKERLKNEKIEFEKIRKELSDIKTMLAEKKARQSTLLKIANEIESEVKILEKELLKLSELKEKRSWLSEDFITTVDIIEKHMLARVYTEFNEFFTEWFNILVEDETLNAKLDEYFTPIIEQNGYETTIENLSGGEKTSVALAYRLALNKVINDFLTNVKTRDLIILDEPTEGFSSDQLDRVRLILHQVKMSQTIIVSHESKMEGFVDSIIRLHKQNHISKIN